MKGKSINGFELKRPLGKGGMAEVWYAENKLGKKAAVKMLLPGLSNDESIVNRFRKEAEIMVALEHPNIRHVYDYGDIDDSPAIVMEYLEGDDLKTLIKQGRHYSNADLIKWWDQMVQALNYTHALGVVHRDIKPSNIFIDTFGNVRLLDFGIAKNNDSGSGTMTGSTLGTRIYMSPEQVKDPKRVDYRTDLYSLAVTFVHLLTGEFPYDTSTASDFEIQLNIVTKPLDISGLPSGWRSLLSPYLEKDPDKRPALRPYPSNSNNGEAYQPNPSHFETRGNERVSPMVPVQNKKENIEEFQPTLPQSDNNETDEGTMFDDGKKQKTPLPTPRQCQPLSSSTDLSFTVNGFSFVMKRVEGGEFWMGAHCKKLGLLGKNPDNSIPNYDNDAEKDESPVHQVKLDSYYIGETVVTQALWKAVMGLSLRQQRDKINPSWLMRGEGDYHPMYYVNRNDCLLFIDRLKAMTGRKFRLPTEAEWEFAARGGNAGKGYRYSGSNDLDKVAWFSVNSAVKANPVMTKQPNELGLYDMSGNVWEWCSDFYGHYYDLRQINPSGASEKGEKGYVIRGGGWDVSAPSCRVSKRDARESTFRGVYVGFRLAMDVS